MATIAEFREFFLRNLKVNVGFKKDQEINYPTTYTVTINGVQVTVSNRLTKDAFPSADVMAKLLQSLTFKFNVEDTASFTQQGLVKLATLLQCENGIETDSNGYQYVVTPSNAQRVYVVSSMPSVAGNYKVGDLFFVANSSVPTSGITLYGAIFQCTDATTPSFTVVGSTQCLPNAGSTGDILTKHTANNFDLQWSTPGIPVNVAYYKAYLSQIGTTAPTIVDAGGGVGASVILNTLASAITWTYNTTGQFVGTLTTGSFNAAKTIIRVGGNCVFTTTNQLNGTVAAGTILLRTSVANNPTNGILNTTLVEIEVYQ